MALHDTTGVDIVNPVVSTITEEQVREKIVLKE